MEHLPTAINTKEIVKQFAAAVQEKNVDLITSMLSDTGKYNIKDKELNVVEDADKDTFISWFTGALSEATNSKIEYDQCILCKMGNPVVIFNDGLFPKMKKDMFLQSMNGLMLEITDGLISGIRFCYYFAKRENVTQVEYLKPKIDRLITKGFQVVDAINIVRKLEGYPCRKEDEGGPIHYIASDLL